MKNNSSQARSTQQIVNSLAEIPNDGLRLRDILVAYYAIKDIFSLSDQEEKEYDNAFRSIQDRLGANRLAVYLIAAADIAKKPKHPLRKLIVADVVGMLGKSHISILNHYLKASTEKKTRHLADMQNSMRAESIESGPLSTSIDRAVLYYVYIAITGKKQHVQEFENSIPHILNIPSLYDQSMQAPPSMSSRVIANLSQYALLRFDSTKKSGSSFETLLAIQLFRAESSFDKISKLRDDIERQQRECSEQASISKIRAERISTLEKNEVVLQRVVSEREQEIHELHNEIMSRDREIERCLELVAEAQREAGNAHKQADAADKRLTFEKNKYETQSQTAIKGFVDQLSKTMRFELSEARETLVNVKEPERNRIERRLNKIEESLQQIERK